VHYVEMTWVEDQEATDRAVNLHCSERTAQISDEHITDRQQLQQ